ncbi:hypothetical protein ASC66_06795 [Leifsonia sp. Root4]|uniref:GNAT family N-acetyltransferase n=1 Tax=Leifsonia sp. Root4 TaxID=1736525 RepID=UPI0006FA68D3|nr:GNAT family N-acetyltransferase [Leifsonia sp. Root4]KQW06231.1 hypothetical protein ASC66_06795 [Leifsonia sp. Root4]
MGDDRLSNASEDGAADDTVDAAALQLRRNDEAHRYEAVLGSDVAGYAEFVLRPPNRIVFTHTVTEPAFTGHGIATRLVEWALSDARDRELRIVVRCPFITSYLETHHQFDDALDRLIDRG